MIKLSYDLHIHSCLSPCGDNDMTPGNIVGMAAVKGLDVIALTDHNACRNCGPAMRFGEEYGVMVIPGMELTTMEEVHVVCLFPELGQALEFDRYVYGKLQKIPNRADIFGHQYRTGEADEVVEEEGNLLINATDISFDEVFRLVAQHGGVMMPAHVDKGANSLIANLGFIPPESEFYLAEVKDKGKLQGLLEQHPYLAECRIFSDSDAHYLGDIAEAVNFFEAEEKSLGAVFEALQRRRQGSVGFGL